MKDYKPLLRTFYDKHGIGRDHFSCRFKQEDKTSDNNRGSESHVGKRYGEPFKIVVLCLDTGGEAENLTERSETVENDGLNPHMVGTRLTLEAILKPWRFDNVFAHFAMVNSAKCSTGGTDKASRHFYENCKSFIQEELSILGPDLLITQGVESREVIEIKKQIDNLTINKYLDFVGAQKNSPVGTGICNIIRDFVSYVSLGKKELPAIIHVHPSERYGRWVYFREYCLPVAADFSRFLLS